MWAEAYHRVFQTGLKQSFVLSRAAPFAYDEELNWDVDRFSRLETLFHAAAALPPHEREVFLRKQERDDPALIEAAMSPEVQSRLMQAPYLIVPTNTKVKMEGEIAKVLAKDHAEMKKRFVFQDWKKINEQRSAWIERFNRDVKV